MGWGHCGTDGEGREIGYYIDATCDHPECNEEIDRGLGYACGGMHGDGNIYNMEIGCEKYFCSAHLNYVGLSDSKEWVPVCKQCYDEADLDDEGNIIPEKYNA